MSYTPDPQTEPGRDRSLGERISRGTEDLSEEARQRVINARRKAIAASRDLKRRASNAQDAGLDIFERQPLIIGALAFAIGAAIGASLPRTRFEDDAFGRTRDDLVSEAERIFAEEKSRATAAIKQVGNEAETAVREAASAAKAKIAEHVPSEESVANKPADELAHVADKAKH